MAKELSKQELKEKLPVYMDAEQRRGYEEFYGIKLICLPGWKAITIHLKQFPSSHRSLEDLSSKHCQGIMERASEIDTFLFNQHDKYRLLATPLMIFRK